MEVKPFALEYYVLYQLGKFGGLFFGLFSSATGFFLLHKQFGTALGNILASVFAVVILVIIELTKSTLIDLAFTSIYKVGIRVLNMVLLFVAIAFFSLSVFLSVSGAGELYKELDKTKSNFTKKIDNTEANIKANYNLKISNLERQLADFKKSVTWQGNINIYEPTTAKTITHYQNQIAEMQKEKQKELDKISKKGGADLKEIETQSEFNLYFWLAISCTNEVLILVCFWFLCFYHAQADKEDMLFGESQKFTFTKGELANLLDVALLQQAQPQQAQPQPEPKPKVIKPQPNIKKLGFDFGENKHENRNDSRNDTKNDTNAPTNQRICVNCGATYIYKHNKQKFCSDVCRIENWNKNNVSKNKKPILNPTKKDVEDNG